MHHAAFINHASVCERILARLDFKELLLKDKKGQTALDIAKKRGTDDTATTVMVLLERATKNALAQGKGSHGRRDNEFPRKAEI